MTWSYVLGEILELVEEVLALSPTGIRDELCDVYTCTMCAIERSTGVPMPILWTRTYYGWLKRVDFWKTYLASVGLEYKVEYLCNGSNYMKAYKRRMVVELAMKDQLRKD